MAKGTTEKMWRKALLLTAALVFVGFGAVVISLFRWQIVRGEEMSIAALDQSLRSTTLSAMRGTIYDATGKVLAQSASVWTVVLEPAYFADYDDPEGTRQKVASGLAAILDMDEEEVYEKTQGSSYFVYLKRRVETSVRDEINEFLEAEGISSGVRLIEDYKRYYPYGTVASTVLGFTGTDGQGLEGLELQYDTQLRALGTDMPFEYEQYVEAQDGNNLVLTIDETVQSILEKYLAEGVDQFNVKNGAVAIMMDVDTGAILGLATTPTYDPNNPFTIYDEDLQAQIDALSGEEQDQAFNDAQLKQWRNKCAPTPWAWRRAWSPSRPPTPAPAACWWMAGTTPSTAGATPATAWRPSGTACATPATPTPSTSASCWGARPSPSTGRPSALPRAPASTFPARLSPCTTAP